MSKNFAAAWSFVSVARVVGAALEDGIVAELGGFVNEIAATADVGGEAADLSAEPPQPVKATKPSTNSADDTHDHRLFVVFTCSACTHQGLTANDEPRAGRMRND